MIKLTEKTINYQQVTEAVRSHNAGAVLLFLGTVREFTGDVHTVSLEYDSYPAMAIQAMEQLKSEACERWSLQDVAIVHRTGKLELGEIAVALAVSSAHRREAFEAGQWLLDTLKQRVPIWKKELYVDGRTEWVHPTQKSPPVVDSPRSTISESKQ